MCQEHGSILVCLSMNLKKARLLREYLSTAPAYGDFRQLTQAICWSSPILIPLLWILLLLLQHLAWSVTSLIPALWGLRGHIPATRVILQAKRRSIYVLAISLIQATLVQKLNFISSTMYVKIGRASCRERM